MKRNTQFLFIRNFHSIISTYYIFLAATNTTRRKTNLEVLGKNSSVRCHILSRLVENGFKHKKGPVSNFQGWISIDSFIVRC